MTINSYSGVTACFGIALRLFLIAPNATGAESSHHAMRQTENMPIVLYSKKYHRRYDIYVARYDRWEGAEDMAKGLRMYAAVPKRY